MKLESIINVLEELAPGRLAQSWDNVGFLVGDPARDFSSVLLTIDVTKAVLDEAVQLGSDLILAYHPVIWNGLKTVTADGPGGAVYEAIRRQIAIYSIHTSLDAAAGGVNDGLAEMVGMSGAVPIGDWVEGGRECCKLVVFVPVDAVDKVADAVFAAGAGKIGSYSRCSFRASGMGTFLPGDGASPAIGCVGREEHTDEIRLESIVPMDRIQAVIAAMRQAHPYEMPAFDVIRLYDAEGRAGLGRMGELEKPATISQILARIKAVTGAKAAGFVGERERSIRTAAVCAGACGKLLFAVMAAKCDLYVTGELKHHEAIAAQEAGLSCICLSHSVSERFILKKLAAGLSEKLSGIYINVSQTDRDPFTWQAI
ncbi:MAG TPA: Nif3-like dinuclear metal center hexameric protein [Sedimentisphaerales bacterium]|nr:Nif3-like dinuclear metal center hexameric protein [Sedimentisphaerales bacterium]